MAIHLEKIEFPLEFENPHSQILDAFIGSVHCRHLDVGSCNACDNELIALGGPHYDMQNSGIDFVASPRHADVLMLTGPITRNSLAAAFETFKATPPPRLVFAVGNCACCGGIFEKSYAVFDGAHEVLGVIIQIPGCPPTPRDIFNALTKGIQALKDSSIKS